MVQSWTHIGWKISQRSIHMISHYILQKYKSPCAKSLKHLVKVFEFDLTTLGSYKSSENKKGYDHHKHKCLSFTQSISPLSILWVVHKQALIELSTRSYSSQILGYLVLHVPWQAQGRQKWPLMTKARADKRIIITPHDNVLCNEKWENKKEDS